MQTIRELLKQAKQKMKNSGIDAYSLEAEVLLSFETNLPREKLLINLERQISEETYLNYVNKRCEGYPLQYITKRQEFMSLDFYVDESVLIPRQDTEILVENVINDCKNNENVVILDMCTGSGCISVSLAYYIKNVKIIAVDLSENALKVASKNAQENKVVSKIEFINSDLFSSLGEEHYNAFDIIVSNPPYIKKIDIFELSTEVKDHEPLLALDGGNDGLDFYRKITEQSNKYLKDNGIIAYEIGYNQAIEVSDILRKNGFKNIEVLKDYAGLDRVVKGIK